MTTTNQVMISVCRQLGFELQFARGLHDCCGAAIFSHVSVTILSCFSHISLPFPSLSPSPGDYEVFGFGGVGIVVRTLTDNPNRAVAQIKAAARKQEVKMASAGSVLFLFDLKGIIHLQPAAGTNTTANTTSTATSTVGGSAAAVVSEERLLEIALDSGVDDVDIVYPPVATAPADDSDSDSGMDSDNNRNKSNNSHAPSSSSSSLSSSSTTSSTISPLPTVVTSPEYLGMLQDALTHQLSAQSGPGSGSGGGDSRRVGNTAVAPSVGVTVAVTVTGELGYIPKGGELVSVSEEDWARNLELIEIFEELEDVDRVYHNMETRT